MLTEFRYVNKCNFKPGQSNFKEKGTVKRLTICRCERPQFLNDPPLKKKAKERKKKKKKNRNEPAPRAKVGWDRWVGCGRRGGEGSETIPNE